MSSESETDKVWTADAVGDKVKAILAAKTKSPVLPDSTFDSLGLDSLAMAEVLFDIETAFGIRADERLLDVQSVREIIALVTKEVT